MNFMQSKKVQPFLAYARINSTFGAFLRGLDLRRGFTLIEVMVTMALLSSLTVGLVGLTQLSVRSSEASRWKTKSMSALNETMEAMMAVRASNFGSLTEGVFYPDIVGEEWGLVSGTEVIGDMERWVEISRVQREISCGGERICPIVENGGVVDPVTFRAIAVVEWEENGEMKDERLESLLTFWR